MTALPITAFAVLGLLSLRDCRVAVELDLWPTCRPRRTGSTTSQWGSSGSWRRCAAGRRVRRAGLGHLIPARKLGSSKPSVAGTETAPAKGRMDVRAVVVKQHGGPEVLEVSDREAPHTGPGQLLVDVAAAGVNFVDIYQRRGNPPYGGDLPYVPGAEGAGTVAAVGPGVAGFAEGDRVAWTGVPGSYAEQVVVPAERAVRVPDGVALQVAAAVMLQGMTAHYLSGSTYPVTEGDPVVVHAAAGGVGRLLTQMVKMRGGTVIGTTSTADKAGLARQAGAHHVTGYESFPAVVREVTDGAGAAVVYDGVGRTTFDDSLAVLRPRGYMVLYGAASGDRKSTRLNS